MPLQNPEKSDDFRLLETHSALPLQLNAAVEHLNLSVYSSMRLY